MLAIDRVIHATHFVLRDFRRERAQSCTDFGMLIESRATHQRHGFVWRKIMAVVLQGNHVQRRDQPIGGISRDNIDPFVRERAIKQTEIEYFGSVEKCRPYAADNPGYPSGRSMNS